MAAILQLRRGAITDFSDYGTNLSEPYFDTANDTLRIGTTDGTGSDADWITLVKLSQANSGSTKDEPNTGSLWIVGDITGSDNGSGIHTTSSMYLSGNITASHAWFKRDVRIDGHLILGDSSNPSTYDVVNVQSDFSGSLIPDNDAYGTLTPVATTAYHDFGTDTKRWRNIYLQRDVNSGSLGGALSGSNIDLTGQIKVDELGKFGYLEIDDLTDNRILLAGPSGRVEDDVNLTYDGQDFRLTNSDYYQSGSGASFQFHGAGMNITGSVTINELSVDNGIVFTNAQGTLDNQSQFTWDGGILDVDGGISASEDLSVGREAYLASAVVKDLTEHRIVLPGPDGELRGDQYFTFNSSTGIFAIGTENFIVSRTDGATNISGSVQLYSTLDVNGQTTLASANVQDLTDGGVVLAGTAGELETSGNLTFDGSLLTVTGDTIITGDLTVQGDTTQLNVTNLNVEDKNILIASGAANAAAADGGGITIDGADATILYGSSDDSITINKQLKVEGNISGSSFGGTTLLSSSIENFADYSSSVEADSVELFTTASDHESRIDEIETTFSSSVDSRLDYLEGPFSTSVDSRLDDTESTGSDHESRIDILETTFSSSVDSRLDELLNYASGSGFYTASNDYEDLTLSRLDGTSQQVDLTPRRIKQTIKNAESFTIAKGTPVYVSGSQGNASLVYAASASRADRMPATYIANTELSADEEGEGLLMGFITGVDTSLFDEGDEVWVGVDGGYQNTRPTGSNVFVQKLGNVIDSAVNGSGVIFGAGRSNDVPNIQEGYLWVGNGDGVATTYTTSSLIPQGTVSGSSQITDGSGIVSSSTATGIEIMTSASYAAITPVSGTLYIIQG